MKTNTKCAIIDIIRMYLVIPTIWWMYLNNMICGTPPPI